MSIPSFLSTIIVTRRHPDELDGVIANMLNQDRPPEEIVVWDNDPKESGRRADHAADPTVRYLCAGEDVGPVVGRNRAAKEARGDILLFLYDYVRFDKYFVTNMIMNAFRPREVACLAFQVRNASSHELIADEYPGKKTDLSGEARDVCAVSPCAFAMRRSMFDELRGFDELLFAGEEGLELAFRALKAGWRIRYLSEIMVNYRTTMREPEPTPPAYRSLRNRLYLALKHLPYPLVCSYAFAWGCFSLYMALRDREWSEFTRGVRAFRAEGLWRTAREYRRAHPPRWSFVTRLQRFEGRFLY
jgi:hypothetical protein